MSITLFQQKVYALCKKIPEGKVSTYGEMAKALNASPRAVGQALRCNPYAPVVPCHRVVCSDGRIGGFAGKTRGKMIAKKVRLLDREGVRVQEGEVQDFVSRCHRFGA